MNLAYFLDNFIIVLQTIFEIIDSNIVFRISFVCGLLVIVTNVFESIVDVIGYK